QEAQRPFNLAQGPLLRAALFQLDKDENIFLLTLHHIISDAWSSRVFIQELSVLYNGWVSGQGVALPELPIQYADFAQWQRQWLQGEVLDEQVSYWREQLRELPALDLPTDFPRPPVQTWRGARQQVLLPARVREGLKPVSQQEGVTLVMTLGGG